MGKRGLLLSGLLWLVTSAGAAPAGLWEAKINGYADKPTAADLNGDGRLEVVVGTASGYMMALSGGNGKLLWELSTDGLDSFLGNPLVADVDNDGRAEILFIGSRLGSVYCVNGEDGSVLWQKAGFGRGVTGSAALAVLRPGETQSLVLIERDTLRCLDALDGTVRWEWSIPGGSEGSVALADIDPRPGREILLGTNSGELLCLSADPTGPTQIWSAEVRGRSVKPPMVVDADRDGKPEIYMPGNAGITRVEANGQIAWRWAPKSKGVSSSSAIYDVTGDGRPEIAVSCSDGSLYVVTAAGKTLWSYPIVTNTMFIPASTPAMADLNGDRIADLIVLSPQSNDAKVHFVDGRTGKRLWTWPMPWFSQGCPLIADLNGDGQLEVVYPVEHGKGLLVCLKLNTRAAGGWLKYGGSLATTGYWPDAMEDAAALVVGRSPFEVQPVEVDWAAQLDPGPAQTPPTGGQGSLPAGGAGRPLTDLAVSLNGNWLLLDPPAVMSAGSVLVPLRGIFEAMRAEVKFEAATKTIRALRGSTEVVLQLGASVASVNGREVKLAAPAKVVNGSTFVPLRFIGEAFGAEVQWDGPARNVIISDPSLIAGGNG